MSDVAGRLLALLLGVALGALFFGGLWWTVRRGVSMKQPALWFLGSLVLRVAAVAFGFYLFAGAHADRLLLCLLGFFAARAVSVFWVRSSAAPRAPSVRGAHGSP